MFASITGKEGFGYQFEKIRNAVAHTNESNVHAATQLGLNILEQKYAEFEQEMDAAGELPDWAYDLATYRHAIEVLRGYFTGNTRGLTERDARIYYHYLETEHEQFCAIAQEIVAEINREKGGGLNMPKSPKQPLFTYAEDWHNNACINGFHPEHWAYSEGYRQAAKLLIAHVDATGCDQDTLVYPMVFLYRHHVELMLKRIISTALDLVERPERYKQKTDNHNLNTLWPLARSLVMDIDKTFPRDNYATLDAVVKAFIDADERATAFRYAQNRTGEPSLTGMPYINTRHFGEMMSKASYELDCMDSHLLHLLCLLNEMRSDWGYEP